MANKLPTKVKPMPRTKADQGPAPASKAQALLHDWKNRRQAVQAQEDSQIAGLPEEQ
jgi:hypothetical protein